MRLIASLSVAALCSISALSQPNPPGQRIVKLQGSSNSATGCVAYSAPQVSITVNRDWGNLTPDALVQANVSLQIFGQAIWYHVRSDCTSQEVSMDFKWRLTYQALDGIPIDATGDLVPAHSLSPTFIPLPGTYHLQLKATHPLLR